LGQGLKSSAAVPLMVPMFSAVPAEITAKLEMSPLAADASPEARIPGSTYKPPEAIDRPLMKLAGSAITRAPSASLKYERVYIHTFETGSALRFGLTCSIAFYNALRPHTALDRRTPDEAYYELDISALSGLALARLNNKLAA